MAKTNGTNHNTEYFYCPHCGTRLTNRSIVYLNFGNIKRCKHCIKRNFNDYEISLTVREYFEQIIF